jgi:hypothetical protein
VANPQQEFEILMARYRFALVSQNRHIKYKNPEGKILIVSKTPSDWRVWHNRLTTLKRVIANPAPSSEVIEEQRQRKELESFIRLHTERKPSVVGISGAGKGKKSRGTGFTYEEKIPVELTAQQIEQQRRARENDLRKAAERKATREVRRAAEEWNRMVGHCKKQIRQVHHDTQAIRRFIASVVVAEAARAETADYLRSYRKEYPGSITGRADREQAFAEVMARYSRQVMEDSSALDAETDKQYYLGSLVYRLSGREPRWFASAFGFPVCLKLCARQIRLVRATVAFLHRSEKIEVEGGTLRNIEVPQWLLDTVAKLHVGVNAVGEHDFDDWKIEKKEQEEAA